MDKMMKKKHRKMRKKAIKLQNSSKIRLSMAEALKRVYGSVENV